MYLFPRLPHQRLGQLLRAKVDIKDKLILDYGSSRGNLLEDGVDTGMISPINYSAMDVDNWSLDMIRADFPEADAIHYDRYNPMYNPDGIKQLSFPQFDHRYHMTYSYSVNTHSSWDDYLFDIVEMFRVSCGEVYTSILDLDCLKILHDKRVKDYGSAVDFDVFENVDTGVYFINNDTVLDLDQEIPHKVDFLLTYYNPEWLISEVSKIGVKVRLIPSEVPGIQPLLEIKDN